MSIKKSLVVSQQLPSYVREGISGNRISQAGAIPYNEDYQTFISFLEAYYEFLESTGNVYGETRNIISYKDIDSTINKFEDYFFNEFLQYFPKESLTDKKFLVKFAKELYERKSTPSSFKFLFRALFDSECELYNTQESVLIASGGKWIRSKFIRLDSIDPRFLNLENYKIFGETSKSIGKIQRSQIISNGTEVFLSDIIREFNSGEYVRIVDDQLNDVIFDGQILRAKVVGTITKVEINPNFTGLLYNSGDPALIIGGLNPSTENPVSAEVEVAEVTLGSVTGISILNGSNGFRTFPNTVISFSGGIDGSGVEARVTAVDNTNPALVTFVANDVISLYANTVLSSNSYGFVSNPTANANTAIAESLEFFNIETYPISEIQLISGGTKYKTSPIPDVKSYINSGFSTLEVSEIGILAPIQILFGGFGYSNGDVINIVGGAGFGAYANVKSVKANGEIEAVQYIYNQSDLYPLGGVFHNRNNLPEISVQSTNNKIIYLTNTRPCNIGDITIRVSSTDNVFVGMFVSGNGIPISVKTHGYYDTNNTIFSVDYATKDITLTSPLTANISNGEIFKVEGSSVLKVPSILGDGEQLGVSIDKIGTIKSFNIINAGQDYISNPEVVLKSMDIVTINVEESDLPNQGDLIYQGDANSPSFSGFVYSIIRKQFQVQTTFVVRIYSYNKIISLAESLYIDRFGKNSKTLSFDILTTYNENDFVSGIKIFGDGTARANAEFINGTVQLQGKYKNEDGFLSSQSVLQSDIFNAHTYSLSLEKEFSKYKSLLYNILHPAGKKVSPRNIVNSNQGLGLFSGSDYHKTIELKYLTHPDVYGVFEEPNRIKIYDLHKEITDTYLSGVISTNSYIVLTSTNDEKFYSRVESIDDINDIIYLSDNIILTFANVAYGYSNGNNVIVTYLTGKYDLMNNGEYKNSSNYLMDIVYPEDTILISNNYSVSINSINYFDRIIYANTELNPTGTANNPSPITITRSFIANSVVIDYNLDNNYIVASGNTVTNINIDGFYVFDESNNLIYVLAEN